MEVWKNEKKKKKKKKKTNHTFVWKLITLLYEIASRFHTVWLSFFFFFPYLHLKKKKKSLHSLIEEKANYNEHLNIHD